MQSSFLQYKQTDPVRFYSEAAQEFCLDFIFESLDRVVGTNVIFNKISDIVRQDWVIETDCLYTLDNLANSCHNVIEAFRAQTQFKIPYTPRYTLHKLVAEWYKEMQQEYQDQSMIQWLKDELRTGEMDYKTFTSAMQPIINKE